MQDNPQTLQGDTDEITEDQTTQGIAALYSSAPGFGTKKKKGKAIVISQRFPSSTNITGKAKRAK